MSIEAHLHLVGARPNQGPSDVILPAQYFRPLLKDVPERRLMIAVFHDALDCLETYRFATNNSGRELFRDAHRWFLANEVDWPYSFEGICAALDLDANAVRRRLRVTPPFRRVSELRAALLRE